MGVLKRYGRFKLSAEMISQQTDNFGKKLETIFTGIIEQYKEFKGKPTTKELYQAIPTLKILESSIFERFGIRVKYGHSDYTYMAVLPLLINKYHVFLDEAIHGSKGIKAQEPMIAGFKDKKGFVDLDKAKVSGIFSTYSHLLLINLPMLIDKAKLDAADLTAVVFHEVGHLFTNYEFSDRLESTNQVLANISMELKNDNNPKQLEYLYKEYIDLTGDTPDKDLFTSGKTRLIIGSRLFKQQFKYVQSQMANRKNDETGAEVVADVFTARMGYAKELVSALSKMQKVTGSIEDLKGFLDVWFNMWLIVLPAVVIATLLLPSSPLIAGIYGLYSTAVLAWVSKGFGANNLTMTYDETKIRYMKVREQYVQLLKNSDLDTADSKLIIESIYSMDAIIKSTKEKTLLITRIGNVLFSEHRDAAADIAFQRLVEELAHNDLFLKSAELNVAIKGV